MYERFEELCKMRGVKPADVSRATKISTATLTSWKKGRYTPKHDKMLLIASYFGVSVEYLEGTSDDKIPSAPQWQEYEEFEREQQLEEQWRLSDFMQKMLKYYRAFNEDGQEHILQTCEDMLQIERFRKGKR